MPYSKKRMQYINNMKKNANNFIKSLSRISLLLYYINIRYNYLAIAGLTPCGNIPFIKFINSSNGGLNNGSIKSCSFLPAHGAILCDDGMSIELACVKSHFLTY
jgi:hypothetical protein